MKGRIKGIGGIFFKCKDPDQVKQWYSDKMGMKVDQYGALFEFAEADQADQPAYLQWSPFKEDTEYFDPSKREFMINYRVENIEALKTDLESKGVKILDEIEEYEYGKFLHILGPEDQKIELWEPIDQSFTDSHQGKTNK